MTDLTQNEWRPTHRVPTGGLQAFREPDPSADQTAVLDPGLEVEVVQAAEVWAQVLCSNGWQGWVDGRLLEPMADTPIPEEVAGLQEALGDALAGYERLLVELKSGRIQGEEFRRGAFEAGLVVRDGEAWLFNLQDGFWCRYDGIGLEVLGEPPEDA